MDINLSNFDLTIDVNKYQEAYYYTISTNQIKHICYNNFVHVIF